MTNSNIGTHDDATTALLIHWSCVDDEYMEIPVEDVAPGWKFLGSGVHRFAYESPDGVVYKVPAYEGERAYEANEIEAKAAAILSQSPAPEGFGVPEVNLFHVDDVPVVAMPNYGDAGEYVDGDDRTTARNFYRNSDTHSGNMRRFGGLLIMIDLGFFTEDALSSEGIGCSCCC